MSSRTFLLALVAALALPAADVQAQEARPLGPLDALEIAIESNPDLRGVRIERDRADLLLEREQNTRVPLYTADVGYRYGQQPRLSPEGTRLIDSSSLVFSQSLAHTLALGTRVGVSTSIGRAARDSVELGELGVAWDTRMGVDVTHPILRGSGSDIVEAPIRSAAIARDTTRLQVQARTSAVVRDVLNAYWEIWLAEQSLDIQEAALALTEQSLENAQIRFEAGALSQAEITPLRLELLSTRERLLVARTTLEQRAAALATLLNLPPSERFDLAESPVLSSFPERADLLQHLQESSYELQQLKNTLEAAEIQAMLAHNNALPRLDAVGSAFIDGLDRAPGSAAAQMFRFEGFVVYAGLRLELPVQNRARQADAERADLAVELARLDIERLEADLTARLVTRFSEIELTRERLDLARESADLAEVNVETQTARFEVGRGTTLEVVDALQRHQEALLRVVEIEVSLLRQLLELEDLTGGLLEGLGISY